MRLAGHCVVNTGAIGNACTGTAGKFIQGPQIVAPGPAISLDGDETVIHLRGRAGCTQRGEDRAEVDGVAQLGLYILGIESQAEAELVRDAVCNGRSEEHTSE